MLRETRLSCWILAALVPLALTGCNGEEGKNEGKKTTASSAKVAPPEKPAEPEAPKFEPGEKGYIAPPDGKATPALIDATKHGNLEAVKAMLETGVDANAARGNGLTALHIAAGENMLEIAKALLDKGADTSLKLEGGVTPLHLAATNAQGLEMVKLLLEHKAALEAKDTTRGHTPLLAAAALGHLEIVRQLLESGADIGSVDKKNRTVLIVAAMGGHTDVALLLLDKGAAIDAQDADGASALHASVRFGFPEVAATLVARGAKVDILDVQKSTPLHLAARFNQPEIADLLLANGANILLKTQDDLTPAQFAAIGKYEQFAKHLSDLEKAAGGPGIDVQPTPQKPAERPPRAQGRTKPKPKPQ